MTAKYYIDAKMLSDNGACQQAQREFNRLFGERMEVTEENMRKVYESTWLYAGWVFDKLRWNAAASSTMRVRDRLRNLMVEFFGGDTADHDRTVRLMNKAGDIYASRSKLRRGR